MKLTSSFSANLELLGILQYISGYWSNIFGDEYNTYFKNNIFLQKTITHYNDFSNDPLVTFFRKMTRNKKFAYDCLPRLFLQYNRNRVSYKDIPEEIVYRANGIRNIKKLFSLIDDFYEKTGFNCYFIDNKNYYDQHLYNILDYDLDLHIDHFEKYNQVSFSNYYLFLNSFDFCNYGGRYHDSPMAIIGFIDDNNRISFGNKKHIIYYIWHEFAHSIFNDIFVDYKKFNSRSIKNKIMNTLDTNFYKNWQQVFIETIIRTTVLRLINQCFGYEPYLKQLNVELNNGYIYVPIINEVLIDYEIKKASFDSIKDIYPLVYDRLISS